MPRRTRGVTLRQPEDVRRVCQRITSRAFQEGAELEFSGRIAQLMGVWLKAFELEKLSELERRISELEKGKG